MNNVAKSMVAVSVSVMACAAAIVGVEPGVANAYGGSCIDVKNDSDQYISVTLDVPAIPGQWDFVPGEGPSTLWQDGHIVIASDDPNHDFVARVQPPGVLTRTWNYDAGQDRSKGCNGAWRLTVSN